MAAYHRVYDSRHLQADCQEPGSSPEPFARQSSMGYLFLETKRSSPPSVSITSGGRVLVLYDDQWVPLPVLAFFRLVLSGNCSPETHRF